MLGLEVYNFKYLFLQVFPESQRGKTKMKAGEKNTESNQQKSSEKFLAQKE